MLPQETNDSNQFEQVIIQAVRQIIAVPNPRRFLRWAATAIPNLLELSGEPWEPNEARRLALLLGTVIWNATPQQANGFQPLPISQPAAADPCLCGSGRRYRDCCENLDEELPELPRELIWDVMLDELPESALQEALKLQAIPVLILTKLAARWLMEDHPKRTVALLEPLFNSSYLAEQDSQFTPALEFLCDAYDRLGYKRKKQNFLELICEQGSRPIKAGAWRRRCMDHIDAGEFKQATEIFQIAWRSEPDHPSIALLEINLLAAQNQDQHAQARAQFWIHRFRQLEYHDDPVLEVLTCAVNDPQEALLSGYIDKIDPLLIELRQWVKQVTARTQPEYKLCVLDNLSSFAQTAELIPMELIPPSAVQQIEVQWRVNYPIKKSLLLQLAMSVEDPTWDETRWCDNLLDHPEVADSLEILDDIVIAIDTHPDSTTHWVARGLLRPLLERAWSILQPRLPKEKQVIIPWAHLANRSVLRLIFRRAAYHMQVNQPLEASKTLEILLRLDPADDNGVRADLMNYYLRAGQNEQALDLASRFPNDMLADLAYGEVLALYRLGLKERAQAVLNTAIVRLPQIPRYLTRARIRQPVGNFLETTPGSAKKAWLYREAMREVWVAEPGILAWLKKLTA